MKTLLIALIFGAVGGLGQTLLAQSGLLRPPVFQKDKIDFGFLSDLIIGAVGGLGSLILGAALLQALNPELLNGSEDGFGKLIGEIQPWVLLASFAVLTGFSSRRFLPAVSDRLTAAIVERVEKETEKAKTELADVASDQVSATLDQVSALTGGALSSGAARQVTSVNALDDLRRLVDVYENISDPAWRERVRQKDECYREMTQIIVTGNMGAQTLVNEFVQDRKQGWVLALAALTSAKPDLGLGSLLIENAKQVDWKHVMYRVASAIGILATQRLLTQDEAIRARNMFEAFPNPDTSLKSKFASTRVLLETRFATLPRS